MVACVSPAVESLEESMYTLRYAMRTRSITNSVVRNVVKRKINPGEVIRLKRENKTIKAQLDDALKRIKYLEAEEHQSQMNRVADSRFDERHTNSRLLNALTVRDEMKLYL